MDSPQKPQRRPRYRGTHPRRFEQKYKEHQPDRYRQEVEKVLASGKTPAGMHRPIMVQEILEVLAPHPGQTVLDCTLGYGGHASALLKAVQPGGRLFGLDVDPLELPKTEERLRSLGFPPEALIVRRHNFAGCARFVAEHAPKGVDLILADLGVSSMQIDNPARGFSFKVEGPLDLRMNPHRGQSASVLLSKLTQSQLAELLEENADEPLAEQLAAQLHGRTFPTTIALRNAVLACPKTDEDTVRRFFQALRIAVNDEFGALDQFLRQLGSALVPGGRVAILTFHSGEDRRVKKAFKLGLEQGTYSEVGPLLRPSPAEIASNPRARSTKLRWAERSR